MLASGAARADDHQVCLNLDLGDDIWDASPRPDSGTACVDDSDCTPLGLTPWEECDFGGTCVRLVSDFFEDRGRNEGARPFDARRWLVRVLDDADDEVLWGWGPLDGLGCTEVFDADATTVRLEWMPWSVSPAGSSILAYGCQLDNQIPSEVDPTQNGYCQPLDELSLAASSVGGSSSDCGGAGAVVDHCSLLEIPVGLTLTAQQRNLWAVTTADDHVNAGASLFAPTQIYLLQEEDGENDATSAAGGWIGGQPSVRFDADQWHSKFVAAHEYGHLASYFVPVAQAGHPHETGDVDYDGDGHTFRSSEYHSAASNEGFAHFVALAAWHDLADADVRYIDLFEEGDAGQAHAPYLIKATSAWNCLDLTMMPPTVPCGAGRTAELNWTSALVAFWNASSAPSVAKVVGMLEAAHDGDWYPNGANLDFINDFDADMASYLTGAEYTDWSAEVVDWELDCCAP